MERAIKWLRRAVYLTIAAAISVGGYQVIYHPDTPLPDHWNPIKPLRITAPTTPLTSWKFGKTGDNAQLCMQALDGFALVKVLDDKLVSDQCHIKSRVLVSNIMGISIRPTETRCDTVLAMAMWLHHGVKPAANTHLGQGITGMRTQGSYNCRKIAGTNRMSTHATAQAIDIAGFTLADGTQVELKQSWSDPPEQAAFWRDIRDASCTWFHTTLGPDYNHAHHDHFHLQTKGWGMCR